MVSQQATDRASAASSMQASAVAPGGAAISVEGLVKSYGTTRAVNGLSFTVAPGEVFALLGPNGAGKTTTIEILEGYRAPDAGTVRVLGLDPIRQARELKLRIGLMLQGDGLHPGLTAREILRLYAAFFPAPLNPEELLDRVGLRAAATTRCRRLSGGQKRRLALALALVGQPALVFLDEPTVGMDPQARLATWDIVRELRAAGTTIVLTTHLMDEAERLADRVAIVNHGRLVALDTPAALTHDTTGGAVQLTAAAGLPVAALAALPGLRDARETSPGVYALDADPAALPDALAALTAWLRDEGVTLTELRVGHGSLEDLFLQLTGREDRP
ncbi:MAG TPA: ABC transporter ATP-binding protein [Thermomicrobiales bacterium]|nr:ABC transporter ATP-binding protein [Thermomicrobiales bacterium]